MDSLGSSTIGEIRRLLDAEHGWRKYDPVLRQVGQWVEITTPYLDRHGDYIQIYAKQVNGWFALTDDGYALNDLEQSGCNLQSLKRQGLLKPTLNGFGVQQRDDTLEVHASPDNFAQCNRNLVQAMLAVTKLVISSRE